MLPAMSTQSRRRLCSRRHVLGALTVVVAAALGCNKPGTAAQAIAAKRGLDSQGNPQVSDDDRCPMCAMQVSAHKDWAGAIELDDGRVFYCCSVQCTLATSAHPDRFLGVPARRVRRVRVPDYLHPGRSLDADSALFVVGSNVRGPMGLTLVPASSHTDAQVIIQRHNGRIVDRSQITDAVLLELKQHNQGTAPES